MRRPFVFVENYIKTNPASFATLPPCNKKEIESLTDEQVEAFLKIADEGQYGAMFKLILFTGLREGEAIGLTWDCVDFKAGVILINKQLQKRPLKDGGFTFAPLKNDKARILAPAPSPMNLRRTCTRRRSITTSKSWPSVLTLPTPVSTICATHSRCCLSKTVTM